MNRNDRIEKEGTRWERAKLLFDIAVKALMQMHSIDRKTAVKLMRDAAEVVD